ncbi:uncharacterized protein LOC134532161 isoform X1 [Bacillus rossius redtenbacheri]|uniref:uncharacterized protein LOC134532161 isoform X1 n=1 Tax=Bacillus rossius redtenbacheri TaxID=93214 RepID=UPI002FDE92F6
MRAVAVSVWIFMNLVLVGMCGYAYLLWSQYWQYVERQHAQAAVTSASRGGLVYYYHGALSATAPARYTRSQPRFPRPRHQEGAVRPSLLAAHRSQLVVQLRRVLLEESSAFRNGGANPYGVRYVGPRSSHVGHSPRELVCELLDTARPRVLSRTDQPFVRLGLAHLLPAQPLLRERYNSCAIVTNAGSLHRSGLGEFIDAHDLVVRFNHAPTAGHERDVGRKTSLRVLNSQVVSRPQFDFLRSPLYRGVRLLAWDPANYTSTLDQYALAGAETSGTARRGVVAVVPQPRLRRVHAVLPAPCPPPRRQLPPAGPALPVGALGLHPGTHPGARAQEPALLGLPGSGPDTAPLRPRGHDGVRAVAASHPALPLLGLRRGPRLHLRRVAPSGRREAAGARPQLGRRRQRVLPGLPAHPGPPRPALLGPSPPRSRRCQRVLPGLPAHPGPPQPTLLGPSPQLGRRRQRVLPGLPAHPGPPQPALLGPSPPRSRRCQRVLPGLPAHPGPPQPTLLGPSPQLGRRRQRVLPGLPAHPGPPQPALLGPSPPRGHRLHRLRLKG